MRALSLFARLFDSDHALVVLRAFLAGGIGPARELLRFGKNLGIAIGLSLGFLRGAGGVLGGALGSKKGITDFLIGHLPGERFGAPVMK